MKSHFFLSGVVYERQDSFDIPFILDLETSVDVETSFGMSIASADLANVITSFAVLSPDLYGPSHVKVNFTTIINYPWVLVAEDFSLVGFDEQVVDGSELLTLHDTQCQDLQINFNAEGCDQQIVSDVSGTGSVAQCFVDGATCDSTNQVSYGYCEYDQQAGMVRVCYVRACDSQQDATCSDWSKAATSTDNFVMSCSLEFEASCRQDWSLIFQSNGVCNVEGTYGVEMKAIFGDEDPQYVQMDMKMALDTACVKTLDSIPAKATGYIFKDSEFTNEHYRYLIGDQVYAKILVDSVGPMASIELETVKVWQEDRSWTINKGETDFNYAEIDVTDSTNPEDTGLAVYFSLVLSNLLEVDISGTDTYLEANILITYGSGSGRRLLSILKPLEPGILSVGRKFQLYPNSCEHPRTLPGRYVEEPCPFSQKTRVRICSKNGWETVVDDCGGTDSLLAFFDLSNTWRWQMLAIFTTFTCLIASMILLAINSLLKEQPLELPRKDSSITY